MGGPSDDQYQSKLQQKNILRVATVKARINAIHKVGSHEETKPIDDPISFPLVNSNKVIVPHYDALVGGYEETKPIDDHISFPLVNSNKVIVPHYDALVLTPCINGFDVHRVLVDPGSAIDLL